MNNLSAASSLARPTRVRYGVLGFACALSMITYLDRVCFGTVAPAIQREFGLSDSQLGMLFTAFALAYAAFEVPSGWLGDMFGARRTLIRIVLWWSLFTALTGIVYPSATWPVFSFFALLAVRFLFGIGEAGAYPNISRAFANWFPFSERGFAQGAVWMAGRFAGGVTTLIVLALLIRTPFLEQGPAPRDVASTFGLAAGPAGPYAALSSLAVQTGHVVHWRHTFWIFGGLGLVWCLLFWWWFRDRPEQHPGVNQAERDFIHGSAGGTPQHSADSHRNVPWRRLLTDLNLWTLCLMYFGAAYGWYFNITWLPKYLGTQYKVSQESHGFWTFSLLAGAPLLVGALACLVGGLATDFFIKRTGNRKWGRRLFGAVGHGACAVCYFLALTARSPYTFVLFVALAAFCNDLTMASAWASCIDIGGKYAGIVAGCMNTIGNLGGAVAGYSTGWALDFFDTQTGWTINFLSFGLVYVLAVFLWLRFDATRQVPQSA